MITLRNSLLAGDVEAIVELHCDLYAREYGFDGSFKDYVACPLSEFARSHSDRERIWIAEQDERIVGCVAIVCAASDDAQLRWYLVHPSARGQGLGTRLLNEAIAFCRDQGYRRIILWTVDILHDAARLYMAAGFALGERKSGVCWGVQLVEEKYTLELA